MHTDRPAQTDLRPLRRVQITLTGIVAADAVVALLFWVIPLAENLMEAYGRLGLPSLFLAPSLGGLVASYIWRTLTPTIGATCLNTLWITLLALVVATLAFHEGMICLLILSPLFFASVLVGALLGRVLFKTYPARLHISLADSVE